MTWSIAYYHQTIEQAILRLPPGLLARYLRLTDLMLEFGPNLGMPHTRAMGEGLFELRVKGQEGIARVFYCTVVQRRIVMLHDCKRCYAMPHGELKHAALQNAAVQAAYEALGPEFEILRQMLQARQDAGLTQAQVAERMGTKPPAVTRLEASLSSGRHSPSLATLQKYAEAVGCRLEVRLVRTPARSN